LSGLVSIDVFSYSIIYPPACLSASAG
jgi:hypothetical protein